MQKYKLKCLYPDCSREYNDSKFRLQCEGQISGKHGPALLQAVYEKKQIEIRTDLPGIFQYADWLPGGDYYIDPSFCGLGRLVCYQSEGLAQRLGLKHLYIAFSGYWPERGGNLLTRSFKEYECQAIILRYLKTSSGSSAMPFLISSAGNTGNAYNLLTHLLGLPLYLVIPETGLNKLWLPFPTKPFVIVVKGDYSDAISLADKIAGKTGLVRDGGVRNIASRAGLSTVMLHAVVHPEQGTKQLFDHYFQAVSSASGAIAAWEAVQLLIMDGRFGNTKTKIHMAQNAPFTPIVDAWEMGKKDLKKISVEEAKEKISNVIADVLTNRNPAYGTAGGVFDVLKASHGLTWRVNNYQLFHAARMFKEIEGVDIDPAAAVAVDALQQAVLLGKVKKNELILLNITGGGREVKYSPNNIFQAQPNMVVNPDEVDFVVEKIGQPMSISHPRAILKNIPT